MKAAVVEFAVTTLAAIIAAIVGGRSLIGEWKTRAVAENANAKATRENTEAIKELSEKFDAFALKLENHEWRLNQVERTGRR